MSDVRPWALAPALLPSTVSRLLARAAGERTATRADFLRSDNEGRNTNDACHLSLTGQPRLSPPSALRSSWASTRWRRTSARTGRAGACGRALATHARPTRLGIAPLLLEFALLNGRRRHGSTFRTTPPPQPRARPQEVLEKILNDLLPNDIHERCNGARREGSAAPSRVLPGGTDARPAKPPGFALAPRAAAPSPNSTPAACRDTPPLSSPQAGCTSRSPGCSRAGRLSSSPNSSQRRGVLPQLLCLPGRRRRMPMHVPFQPGGLRFPFGASSCAAQARP